MNGRGCEPLSLQNRRQACDWSRPMTQRPRGGGSGPTPHHWVTTRSPLGQGERPGGLKPAGSKAPAGASSAKLTEFIQSPKQRLLPGSPPHLLPEADSSQRHLLSLLLTTAEHKLRARRLPSSSKRTPEQVWRLGWLCWGPCSSGRPRSGDLLWQKEDTWPGGLLGPESPGSPPWCPCGRILPAPWGTVRPGQPSSPFHLRHTGKPESRAVPSPDWRTGALPSVRDAARLSYRQ